MGNLVNYEHPITGPILIDLFNSTTIDRGWRQTVYLGYVPILLIALALARSGFRRRLIPWLLLALVFLILRLGYTLTINGVEFESIRLPKYYLAKVFPHVFLPFWYNDKFHAGALLPLSVLTCYGLLALLKLVSANRRVGIILVVTGIIAFEYYQSPDPVVIPDDQLEFINWLRAEDDQESIHLINLPIGGQHSKYYDFYQTLNGYPHVEGRPTRTPSAAYNYIDSNPLLYAWRWSKNVHCLSSNRAEYNSALDQLAGDGFTHIIRHRRLRDAYRISLSFTSVRAAYGDDHVSIYRLEDMRDSCKNAALHGKESMAHLTGFVLSAPAMPDPAIPLLSLHSSRGITDETFRLYSHFLSDWRSLFHIYEHDAEVRLQTSDTWYTDPEHITSRNNFILVIYDPSEPDPQAGSGNSETVLRHFKPCQRVLETAETIAEFYIKSDFPCDLITADSSLRVQYENGIQLANLLHKIDEESIDLYLWWKNRPLETPAISLQLFAKQGVKVAQQDFVIGHQPLARHRIDISGLSPGDYLAKLILYNYDTGVSVPGTVTSSQTHFDRELEIARITID